MSEFKTLGTIVREKVTVTAAMAASVEEKKREARKRIAEARSADDSAVFYCQERIREMLGLSQFPAQADNTIIGYYNENDDPVFAANNSSSMESWHVHEYEDGHVCLETACRVHLFAYDIGDGLFLHSRGGHDGVYACSLCPYAPIGESHYRLSPSTLDLLGLAPYLKKPGISGDWACQACRLLGKEQSDITPALSGLYRIGHISHVTGGRGVGTGVFSRSVAEAHAVRNQEELNAAVGETMKYVIVPEENVAHFLAQTDKP